MTKVSVIVPNYNHANYLQQRIDSILLQTFRDFEVIILDDCSPDNSREIIEGYRNNKKVSHIIYNDINSGSTFRQWQKGIELATGEYIWIAESDDWCEPSFLETLINGITAKENCMVAYCQSYCTDSSKILWVSQSSSYLSEYREGKDFVNKLMLMGNSIFNASMAVWRRSAFENISKAFMEFRFCGDWLFWIELCLQGDVFITGKALNYFRKHDEDISGKVYKSGYNFLEEIKLIDTLLDRKQLTENLYLASLKEKFARFNLSKEKFSNDTIAIVEKSFFKDKATKKYLLNNGNNVKKITRKILSRLK